MGKMGQPRRGAGEQAREWVGSWAVWIFWVVVVGCEAAGCGMYVNLACMSLMPPMSLMSLMSSFMTLISLT